MTKLVLLSFLVLAFGPSVFAQCSFLNIGAITTSGCDVNGTFSIYGTVEVDNAPSTGDLTLNDCQGRSVIVASAPFDDNIFFSGDGFQGNGSFCAVFFEFSDIACISESVLVSYPSCNCNFVGGEMNRTACNPSNNTYTLSGEIEFEYPPSSGQLVIENCYGSQVVIEAASLMSGMIGYTIEGMPADDLPCFITAYFTADPDCRFYLGGWTNTPSCDWDCVADAGTYTISLSGNSSSLFPNMLELCFGDEITITSNGDFRLPAEVPGFLDVNNTPIVYDPGIWLAVYDCEPTIEGPHNFVNDPCFVGLFREEDAPWTIQNSVGDNETRWFVPVTIYSQVDHVFSASTVILDQQVYCYDLGTPVGVTFLPSITGVINEFCTEGKITVVVNGGEPSLRPETTFSIVPESLTPANATIVQGTATTGNMLIIDGVEPGQDYGFIVKDELGCQAMFSGIIEAGSTIELSYPNTGYCVGSGDVFPVVTGNSGGIYSSTTGLIISQVTGMVNTNISQPGNYTITYRPSEEACALPVTTTLSIYSLPIISTTNEDMCIGSSLILTVSGAQSYSWTPSVIFIEDNGERVSVSPPFNTVYTIVGSDVNGCQNTTTSTITVFPIPVLTGILSACAGETSQLSSSSSPNVVDPFISMNVNIATVSPTGLVTAISAGTTDIIFTNDKGCQRRVVFTVLPLPVVSVNSAEVCPNSTVTLTAQGAVSYLWTPTTYLNVSNAASVIFTPGVTTSYSLTGSDIFGCSSTVNTTVTVFASPNINAGPDQTICLDNSTTISASGGVTYTWDNGLDNGQSHTITPNNTTTYTVIGTDANECFGTDEVVVTVALLPSATISGSGSYCLNEPSPEITFTAIGGTPPYQFTYSINGEGAQTVSSASDLATITVPTNNAGIFVYELQEVSDQFGCENSLTSQATIQIFDSPDVNLSSPTDICKNDANQLLIFRGVNGRAPYAFSYKFNNGPVQTLNSNGSGLGVIIIPTGTEGILNYQVTHVIDANGCEQDVNVQHEVTIRELPTATILGGIGVCQNETPPQVVFLGTNGIPPFTFTYTVNGGPLQTVVSSGTSAIVWAPTDQSGTWVYNLVKVEEGSSADCSQLISESTTIIIHPTPSPIIEGDLEYCFGQQSFLATSLAYSSYLWSNGQTGSSVQVTEVNNPITVSVTDEWGCFGTSNPIVIEESERIINNATISACQGQEVLIHGQLQSVAGTYSITTLSVEGCDSVSNVTLVINPLPTVLAGEDRGVCEGEMITLSGEGAIDYIWNHGVINGIAFQPTQTQNYTVIGTDVNGCSNSAQVLITVNQIPVINPILNQEVCNNGLTTDVILTADIPNTIFQWINTLPEIGLPGSGDGNILAFMALNSSNMILTSQVLVTPVADGCLGTALTFTYTVSPSPSASISGGTAVCVNGLMPQVTFEGTNGIAPYTFRYQINNGPVMTANSISNTAFINVPVNTPGIFTYTLVQVLESSALACESVTNQTTTFTIIDLPNATVLMPNSACHNDNSQVIELTAIGGQSPYRYTYSVNGGVEQTFVTSMTVVTMPLETAEVGLITFTLISITEGSTAACSQVINSTSIINIMPAPRPTITGILSYCENSTTTLSTQSFPLYNWSTGAVTDEINVTALDNPITVQVVDANGCTGISLPVNVSSLPIIRTSSEVVICQGASLVIHGVEQNVAGSYIETFLSSLGCDSISTVILSINPLPIVIAPPNLDICHGEMVTLVAQGADSYDWSDGALNGVPFQPEVGSLSFTVIGTDTNGCQNTATTTVTVKPLPVIDQIGDLTYCNGITTLEVTFISSPSASISWLNTNVEIGLSRNGDDLIPSFITTNTTNTSIMSTLFVVGTLDGCTGEAMSFQMKVLPDMQLDITTDDLVFCQNTEMASFTVNLLNNTAPYILTYSIDGGSELTTTGNELIHIPVHTDVAGTFIYTIFNIQESGPQSCITNSNESVSIIVYELPIVDAGDDVQVCSGTDYLLTAVGTAVNYYWSSGQENGSLILVDSPVLLTVTGVSSEGCQNTDQLEITTFPKIPVVLNEDESICLGEEVILYASMSDGSFGTFDWSDGVINGEPFTPNETNMYIITSVDMYGCQQIGEVTITVQPLPIISAGSNRIVCFGEPIILTGEGADGGTYEWNNGVINGQPFLPSEGGHTYTVIGTDQNGCQNTSSIDIMVESRPEVSFIVTQDGLCAPVEVQLINTSEVLTSTCIWYIEGFEPIIGCDQQSIILNNTGNYSVTLSLGSNVAGCAAEHTSENVIRVEQTPVAYFTYSPSEVTEINSVVEFFNSTVGEEGISYFWEFGDLGTSTSVNPIYDFKGNVAMHPVTLTATSLLGCKGSYTHMIRVSEDLVFYIPNAFTPNDDELNQTFQPVFVSGYDPSDYELIIYNRWGEKIFESHDVAGGWNGRYGIDGDICPVGMYVWTIVVRNSSSTKAGRSAYNGHVSLIR